MKYFFQENAGEIHFLRDLFHSLDSTLKQRKKPLSLLRYARPTDYGWSFFAANVPWDILDDIAGEVIDLHRSCCSKAKIIDALSELVNLPESDFSQLRLSLS